VLILTGSYSSVVADIALAGIGFVPLAFLPKERSHSGIQTVVALVALGLAVSNLVALAKAVNHTDMKDRLAEEKVILELASQYPKNQPIYLSGFISAGEGTDTITSLARLEFEQPFYIGVNAYHSFQFGLPIKLTSFTEQEMDEAAACGLQRAFNFGGLLMLVEPSRVDEKPIRDWMNGHFFGNQLAERMDRIALASGRLEDTGVAETLETIPVRFYRIKPGPPLNLPIGNCPP
jgi:hypothetical protein